MLHGDIMPILNIKILKIGGERKGKIDSKVTANAKSTISSIKKEKDGNIGDHLLVDFRYNVEYEPDIGSIVIEGKLWYVHPELKTMIKEEKDTIELKKEVVAEISTGIVRESLLESLEIARKLQLPPPMQLPKVEVKPDQMKFKKAS